MRRYLAIFISMLFFLIHSSAQNSRIIIDGYIKNKSGEPLGFSVLQVNELNLYFVANADGYFKFSIPREGGYSLTVNYLNHIEKQLNFSIKSDQKLHLNIALEEKTYALDELIVMPQYKNRQGANAEISQVALEHIQPSSIADVLVLTPGGLYSENKITGFNRISVRQAGTDNNSSLGMAIVADGIPLDNDGFRSQLPGFDSDYAFANRTGLNEGVDMKSFSTDHIQKMEIVKGISSAKLGNLSSGAIQMTSKIGESPLQIRLKTDPLTKLVYIGKGQAMTKKRGSIHAGFDLVSAYDDRRDPMSKFLRASAQISYKNSYEIANRPLEIFLKLSEIYTLNQSKEDELTIEYNETYKNYYSRSGLSFKARLSELSTWMNSLEFISFLDYSYDLIDRNRMVQNGSPRPSPIADTEGENEGIYLPSKYYSPFKIENKPLSLLNQLNMQSVFKTSTLQHKLIYGLESKFTKNYGEGAILDMQRPPYPGNNTYVRPRANKTIPALVLGSAYIEDQIHFSKGDFKYNLSAGLRASKMFNLNKNYIKLNKLLLEPRINMSLSHQLLTKKEKSINNNIRFGFGQENKLPTLDYLYPDYIYKDFVLLSAYINKGSPYNYLLTLTKKYDVTNYKLKANKNNKFEVGWDLSYDDYLLSLTAFKEFSDAGFNKNGLYTPISYLRYMSIKEGTTIVGRKPQKSDYNPKEYHSFVERGFVQNSSKLVKKGIEYRLKFPKINLISTNIEINGAYYNTSYSESKPKEYHPSFKDENKTMPYVGIYTDPDIIQRNIFNSNIWLNTNIPSLKMIFTSLIQFIWTKETNRINGSFLPSSYLDLSGIKHPIDDELIQKIKEQDLVWRHYNLFQEPYYEKEPISVTINLKATKEFNKHLRAAFFVNNLFDINPSYKNRYEQNVRIWRKAFFGAEMTVSF